jgi:hypothetical protein
MARRPRLVGVLKGHRLSRRVVELPRRGGTAQTYCTECGLQVGDRSRNEFSVYPDPPACESGSRWASAFVVKTVMRS